jgi:hypothetical protein
LDARDRGIGADEALAGQRGLLGELGAQPPHEDVGLVGEVPVQRVAGQPDLGRDVREAHLAVAALDEQADGRGEDRRLLLGDMLGDRLGADARHDVSR